MGLLESAETTNAATHVNVASLIDDAPLLGLPACIAGFAFALMITDGLDLQAMAFAAPGIVMDWATRREELGPVLSASVAGMAVGSILLGWLGDRAGRRIALGCCIGLLGLGSLGSALSGSLNQLVFCRLVTGIGLGGAAPIAATVSAEWVPARWRTPVVVGTIVGVPLGGMLGAEWSALVVPLYGWRSVFWTGFVLAALFSIVAASSLPESPKYLISSGASGERIAAALNRLVGNGTFSGGERFEIPDRSRNSRGPLRAVLSSPHSMTTLLLCLVFACNSLTLYGLVNWLPTVLSASGFSLANALRGSFWFNCGGIAGALLGSTLAGNYGSRFVGPAIAVAGVLGITLTGEFIEPRTELFPYAIALSGASINAIQTLLYALAAYSYPTALRGSGTGFASAAARIGGVLSSVVGTALFALGLATAQFFYLLAASTIATGALFFFLRAHIPAYSKPGA